MLFNAKKLHANFHEWFLSYTKKHYSPPSLVNIPSFHRQILFYHVLFESHSEKIKAHRHLLKYHHSKLIYTTVISPIFLAFEILVPKKFILVEMYIMHSLQLYKIWYIQVNRLRVHKR